VSLPETPAIDWQIEALVGQLAGLLPFLVIIDQVPERDVIAALHQEQTAGAQGVADAKGEGDFPDGAVEFAACFKWGRQSAGTKPCGYLSSARRLCRHPVPAGSRWPGQRLAAAAAGMARAKKAGRYWRKRDVARRQNGSSDRAFSNRL